MKSGKAAAIVFFAAIFLVLSSFTAFGQAGCCCDLSTGLSFEGRTALMEAYEDCVYPYNIIVPNSLDIFEERDCIQICAVRAGVVEPGEPPPVAGAMCGDVGYKPAPANFQARNVKGEKQIRLLWDVECPVDHFVVGRCDGNNCDDFEPIKDQFSSTYYIDNAPSLLWDADYTYQVTAHYNLQGESDPAVIVANTGDIECWHIETNEKFCLSRVYYAQFTDYFQAHGYKDTFPGDFMTNLTGSIKEQFFDKFNKAYFCDDDNKLNGPDDICATKGILGGICVADAGVIDCIAPSDCQDVASGGFFGLYYSSEQCEGTPSDKKFCHLDRSKSIVDKCYQCRQDMSCFDYRSSGACGRDNCGVGECEWRDIYPDIGIGVCVDRRFPSCYLCDARPEGGSSESFNEVFEQCSEEKSDALSTTEFPCYWLNWESKSCDQTTCTTYMRPAECGSPSGGIQLADDNSVLVGSTDTCEIGVCQWRPDTFDPSKGECLKNADGDTGNWPDCTFADDEEKCELDYVPPDTEMVATGALGVYDRLNINIFDKISKTDPGEYKTGSKATGYTTYFCHYPQGGSPCNVHLTNLTTEVGVLALNFLTLHNTEVIESQTKMTDLVPGYNIIKYYSKDPSNNPGLVKEVSVFACARCVGPDIVNSKLSDSFDIAGKTYTNSPNPVLFADFNVWAEITTAEVDSPDGVFISSMAYTSDNNMNYTFSTDAELEEGSYQIRINAKDDEGTYMNEEFSFPFIVDLTAGNVNITIDGQPAEGAIINKKKANVDIQFAEPISNVTVTMNGRDVTGAFTPQPGNRKIIAQNMDLDEGIVALSVEAKDLAGNDIYGLVIFNVNGEPPMIRIREPSFGVSDKFKFDVVIETLNNVECRYLYDFPLPANFTFIDLEPFDETGTNLHAIRDFTRIPDGDYTKHKMHVVCIDPLWGRANASFDLSVDVDPPVIVSAIPDPEIIKEALAQDTFGTTFKVGTSELTFCKYSESEEDYDDMEGIFKGYIVEPHIPYPNSREVPKKAHMKQINVSEANESYTYYVACEDLAGRVSVTKPIDFSVDLGIPFTVTDHTPKYANSTSMTLFIETNKRAFCLYGRESDSVTSSFQNDGEYSHTTELVNLPLGVLTFYVQCITKFETPKETAGPIPITFTVDTTPPEMVYVNDTSALPNDPDFSYFTDQLRVNWLGKDNESNVTRYYYTLETFYGKTMQFNWTPSTIAKQWIWVTGLNLTPQTTYRFLVKPANAAGLTGNVMESDGVTIDPGKMPAECNNSVKDGTETDLDCGGACIQCIDGKECLINADCQSSFCDNSTGIPVCKAPACDDGIKNGDETGPDCGGSCEPCSLGALCISDSDCAAGRCQNGLCAEPDPCFNGEFDGTETDVDCGGSCPDRCNDGQSCMIPADCSSGLCIAGLCEPRRGEGGECENESVCRQGLICRQGFCTAPKNEEGESCTSTSDCYEPLLCFEGRCALDSDGDGLPDEWELRYGLDPNNPSDAMFDSDNDGIPNQREFQLGTDPSNRDSDGDKWWDGQEMDFGTSPTDADSKPSSWMGMLYHPLGYWWMWLLILIILLVIGVLAFYGYNTYKEFKKKKEKEKERAKAKAPARKPAAKPEKARLLTPEERRLLAEQAKKDKEISTKLEKLKGIIEKKAAKPKEKVTDKEWKDIRSILVPVSRKKPEVSPIFKKIEKLRKGKLGVRGRKHALKELDRLLGKEAKKVRKEAEKEEEKAEEKKPFEKLKAMRKKTRAKQKQKEKRQIKRYGKGAFGKLKLIALSNLPPEERRKVLEKFMLLRTGKLNAKEKKELFEKLKITSEYYIKHKGEFEKELKKTSKKKKVKKE